ncbi:hypothetical protein [Indiicoccus explosivorum]|uniref:hypothetical protein n=1 Tax=Indiicoccus explosivorum TaxID=1917864 RepID=UPI000B43E1E1|nr:hypothetical protein [Indiicoccus explosivorum]
MEEPKKYKVIYHLGDGMEAVEITEAHSTKEAAADLESDDTIAFTGENGVFYKFSLTDVKMISVDEYKEEGPGHNQAVL